MSKGGGSNGLHLNDTAEHYAAVRSILRQMHQDAAVEQDEYLKLSEYYGLLPI